MPAARQGDMMVCIGPPDSIKGGSGSVSINGKPAARMGDSTSHGGVVMGGSGNVFIGDSAGPSSAQAKTLSSKAPFCEECIACQDDGCAI
ncbi:PAAR domain-containing protein [Photobacterium japonica]